MQAVHERIGGGHETVNESTVPKHSTTTQQTSVVKKPNKITHAKRHSDSDDHEDPDEPQIIKSVPGNSRTTKGATGGASRGGGLRFS